MPPQPTDRRVRRTRKLLQDGLLKLLCTKPLDDITVKELAEAADVARATVYVHYRDPVDILQQLEQAIYAEVGQLWDRYSPAQLAEDPSPFLQEVLAYMVERQGFFQALFGAYGDKAFLNDLRSLCQERLAAVLALREPKLKDAALSYRAIFTVGGYETVLRQWMADGCRDSSQVMALLPKGKR